MNLAYKIMDFSLNQPGSKIGAYDYILIISTIHENFIPCFINMINSSKRIYNHLRVLLTSGETV